MVNRYGIALRHRRVATCNGRVGNAKVPTLPPGITFFPAGRGSSGLGYYPRQIHPGCRGKSQTSASEGEAISIYLLHRLAKRTDPLYPGRSIQSISERPRNDEIANDDVQSFARRVVIRQVSRMQQADDEQEGDGLDNSSRQLIYPILF